MQFLKRRGCEIWELRAISGRTIPRNSATVERPITKSNGGRKINTDLSRSIRSRSAILNEVIVNSAVTTTSTSPRRRGSLRSASVGASSTIGVTSIRLVSLNHWRSQLLAGR